MGFTSQTSSWMYCKEPGESALKLMLQRRVRSVLLRIEAGLAVYYRRDSVCILSEIQTAVILT